MNGRGLLAVVAMAVVVAGCARAGTVPVVRAVPDAASIPDGTWRVGGEVVPGTYRATGAPGEQHCFWERLSGFTGTLDDVIVNGLDDPPVIVTILSTDKGFTSAHCGGWTRTQ